MSTDYKILTKGLNLTRLAGGNFECHLHIHKYVSYDVFYSLKLNYTGVVSLKSTLINFLRDNVSGTFKLCEGFKAPEGK